MAGDVRVERAEVEDVDEAVFVVVFVVVVIVVAEREGSLPERR